ncbi:hypothetical protein K525DRAFT_274291 [Schizophyllum commune Loenen D]|nr:hypothetical protein K525DRAFT_274291 [Schizophyllum commune Loenen D]
MSREKKPSKTRETSGRPHVLGKGTLIEQGLARFLTKKTSSSSKGSAVPDEEGAASPNRRRRSPTNGEAGQGAAYKERGHGYTQRRESEQQAEGDADQPTEDVEMGDGSTPPPSSHGTALYEYTQPDAPTDPITPATTRKTGAYDPLRNLSPTGSGAGSDAGSERSQRQKSMKLPPGSDEEEESDSEDDDEDALGKKQTEFNDEDAHPEVEEQPASQEQSDDDAEEDGIRRQRGDKAAKEGFLGMEEVGPTQETPMDPPSSPTRPLPQVLKPREETDDTAGPSGATKGADKPDASQAAAAAGGPETDTKDARRRAGQGAKGPGGLPRPKAKAKARKKAKATDGSSDDYVQSAEVQKEFEEIRRLEQKCWRGWVIILAGDRLHCGDPINGLPLLPLHGNRELDAKQLQVLKDKVDAETWRPNAFEHAIKVVVQDGVFAPDSLIHSKAEEPKRARFLPKATRPATCRCIDQCNGNHRVATCNYAFRQSQNCGHIEDRDFHWTAERYEALNAPDSQGFILAEVYSKDEMMASRHGKTLQFLLASNNLTPSLGDAQCRQLYRALHKLYDAPKEDTAINTIMTNQYAPGVKTIIGNYVLMRQMGPDLAVITTFSRDTATIEKVYNVEQLVKVGVANMTIIGNHWFATKDICYAGMTSPFNISNVLDREVGDEEVEKALFGLARARGLICTLRMTDVEVAVMTVITSAFEQCYKELPAGAFVRLLPLSMYNPPLRCDDDDADNLAAIDAWEASMRIYYRSLHACVCEGLSDLKSRPHAPAFEKELNTLHLDTLPDVLYAVSLLDATYEPSLTPLKWCGTTPMFCPSLMGDLLEELSKKMWLVITEQHLALALSFVVPGLFWQRKATRASTKATEAVRLLAPLDVFVKWMMIGWRGYGTEAVGEAEMKERADKAACTIMSYVFEIGDELAMPDVTVAVRGLAGGQTLEDAHPAVQHALCGLIEDYYDEWKAIDKRSRSEAEEVENFLPPHIIEKRATLRKQRKEELSKRDTELLEAAVTITASLPFGILQRPPSSASRKAGATLYHKHMARAVVSIMEGASIDRLYLRDPLQAPMVALLEGIVQAVEEAYAIQDYLPFIMASTFVPTEEICVKYSALAALAMESDDDDWCMEDDAGGNAASGTAVDGAGESGGRGGQTGTRAGGGGGGGRRGDSARAGTATGSTKKGKEHLQTATFSLPRTTDSIHPAFAAISARYESRAELIKVLDAKAIEKARAHVTTSMNYAAQTTRTQGKVLPVTFNKKTCVEHTVGQNLLNSHKDVCATLARLYGGQNEQDFPAAAKALLLRAPLVLDIATPELMADFHKGGLKFDYRQLYPDHPFLDLKKAKQSRAVVQKKSAPFIVDDNDTAPAPSAAKGSSQSRGGLRQTTLAGALASSAAPKPGPSTPVLKKRRAQDTDEADENENGEDEDVDAGALAPRAAKRQRKAH